VTKPVGPVASAGTLLCALVLVLVVSACGGKDGAVRSGDGEETLTELSSTDVDFLDPGRTYFALGFQVALATQRPLYRYRPDDLSRAVPDLAAAMPSVSADGRTITVRLRRGVRFSPPVDREVTARDVAYAFERFFSANVAGPYTSYFADLVGAPPAPTRGVRPISGISTPDTHTIVFRLKRTTSATFIAALSLPASAPVPEEYARRFDAKSPSTYNTHLVASGPYMVRNDKAGKAVGYRAGRSIELVRNPNWRAASDPRPAHLHAIRIRTNATDTNVAARQVLAGESMVLDGAPPPSILKRVVQDDSDQGQRLPSGGFRFLPINTTLPPFDRRDVRKAFVAGFDREAARLARGGATTGPLATHYLPPGIQGFEEAGGFAGPGDATLAAEGGDERLAAEHMMKAGFPSGRYTGDATFLIVAGSSAVERATGEIVQHELGQLGFKTRLRSVPTDSLYTDWCGVPGRKVLICASGLAWLKDYPDPQPMLQPVFDGDKIVRPTGNSNYSQLDVPKINAAMAAAETTSGKARAAAWGAIDRMIVAEAAAVPLQWDVATLIRSKNVKGVTNVYFNSWDLSFTSLR
jgi:peptide/nickel transport system substrate-binding protein